MHNTSSALPALPCFVCGENAAKKFLFRSRGHYPSTLLDDDGQMFVVLCRAHLEDGLNREVVRRYAEPIHWRSIDRRFALPCVKCKTILSQYGGALTNWRENQPVGGLSFEACQQALSACDQCLRLGRESGTVHLVLDDE